jgi:transcriptional regulator of heat shock response
VEQEASVLRTKTQTLEQDNEKLLAEVKKLQLQNARNSVKASTVSNKDGDKMKATIDELEKERDELKAKIKRVLEDSVEKMPARTPKVFSDMKTKLQLKV